MLTPTEITHAYPVESSEWREMMDRRADVLIRNRRALGPVDLAYMDRDWPRVRAKLRRVMR